MSTFFMFGKYTSESLREISVDRTQKAKFIISKMGGEIKSIHVLLGEHDLVAIVDMPDTESAVKASLALNKELGISFSTSPAISVEEFDKLSSEI